MRTCTTFTLFSTRIQTSTICFTNLSCGSYRSNWQNAFCFAPTAIGQSMRSSVLESRILGYCVNRFLGNGAILTHGQGVLDTPLPELQIMIKPQHGYRPS